MKTTVLILCLVGVALLGVIAWVGHQHGAAQHRALVWTVTRQLNGHASQIGELLAIMRGSNVALVEEAAYLELQALPSSSLISRSMIRVAPAADGFLECVIDTSSFGIASRTVRASRPVTPK